MAALENRVLELLDSGRPLTISAEGKSYVLPPVKAPLEGALPENLLTRRLSSATGDYQAWAPGNERT